MLGSPTMSPTQSPTGVTGPSPPAKIVDRDEFCAAIWETDGKRNAHEMNPFSYTRAFHHC